MNVKKRRGIVDVWHADMAVGADFISHSTHDIPYCPTTAKSPPCVIIDWVEAEQLYRKARRKKDFFCNAFVSFYVDDIKFDGWNGIWRRYKYVLKVLRHFAGAISPDFSICQDFPYPIKVYNIYRSCLFGYWLGKNGIPIIPNVRWGTPETYDYCWDGLPYESMYCIGTVGGSPARLCDRERFEQGLYEFVRRFRPKVILVYGSDRYPCFERLREQGITVISYPARTARFFDERGRS